MFSFYQILRFSDAGFFLHAVHFIFSRQKIPGRQSAPIFDSTFQKMGVITGKNSLSNNQSEQSDSDPDYTQQSKENELQKRTRKKEEV